jgi:DNA replication protein DnaC
VGSKRPFLQATNHTTAITNAATCAQIGDPSIADSILDRLVHNAHRIELKGESMRKKRTGRARESNS